MGCVSSKQHRKDFKQRIIFNNVNYTSHVVSLTSSTLGVLKLDQELKEAEESKEAKRTPPRISIRKSPKKKVEELEVINAWELMSDLEEELGQGVSTPLRKSPKSQILGAFNPSKFFNQVNSPKKQWKSTGKENKKGFRGRFSPSPTPSPKQVLKPCNSTGNWKNRNVPVLKCPFKSTPDELRRNSFQVDSGFSTSRKSLSPLFDPKLIESIEKELQTEGGQEQIKKMVSPKRTSLKAREAETMLQLYDKKCPPGGENRIVIYTTTLRGIRKTFEDCNVVRAVIESHQVQMLERDISMDSGYREELRKLMGRKDVKVPLVFVKGRLIGGADEVMKLEEESKLGVLFDGIPIATGCEGCGGLRFVMCMDCNGSCKVLNEVDKKMSKCEKCNENGLIQCPICC